MSYEVVLDHRYYLRDIIRSITLEESLYEIAYRATIPITVTPDFPEIFNGQPIKISGLSPNETHMIDLLDGFVWDIKSTDSGQKYLTAIVYDRSIYMARSEDEYLFPSGHTASQRLKKYAADWGIPINTIPDTNIPLSKAVYRAQPLFNMIMADLRETAEKGGELYTPRMTGNRLNLYRLGSNKEVWELESVKKITQRRTLEGSVTQVKVLGKALDDKRSPVLTIEKDQTEELGTIQKVIQHPKIDNLSLAKTAAKQKLSGVQETFTVSGIDINTIRAGDKVILNNIELLVVSVRHKLGIPGEISLELAYEDYIRRNYYGSS
nr:hypothetical protein 5 [bacterium]BDD46360.1 hypothetical protein 6 [Pelagibacterales bacterium]